MKIIRKSELIQSIAKRWHEAYCYRGRWDRKSQSEVYERLLTLGEDATEEQVTGIIGDASWTRTVCSECGCDVDLVVHFGEEPDYDAVWADVCLGCLRKAEQLLVEGMDQEYMERPDGYVPGMELR